MNSLSKKYCLEHKNEADRLEYQSSFSKYDFRAEFKNFGPQLGQKILDAGSGSGIVLRHFATLYPDSQFIGCDMSDERVSEAKERSSKLKNVSFQTEDLRELTFSDQSFDHVLSRYVVEHVPKDAIQRVMSEIFRVLKPGGQFHCVDFDGPICNLYPMPEFVQKVLNAFSASPMLDLWIGRKIPHLMVEAGFTDIKWRIETVECQGTYLDDEFKLLPEKFDRISDFVNELMSDNIAGKRFKDEYLSQLRRPGTVLYYNKFIVEGSRPKFALYSPK